MHSSCVAGLAGGGFGGVYATVATLALLEIDQRCKQVGTIEIGPKGFGDEDFGVRNLPEEEIADTHFSAGADEEIGIGKIDGIEMARELFLGDGVRTAVAVAFAKDGVHGIDDFRAAAVVEGDRENHAAVARGGFRGFAGIFLDGQGKFFGASEETQADIVSLKERHFFANVLAKELHKEFDFGSGAAPVFHGESIEGERFDVKTRASFDGGARGFRACAMSGDTGQMTLLCPATVAVHDHGDVPGEAGTVELFEERGFLRSDRAEAFRRGRAGEHMFQRVRHRKIPNVLYAAKLTYGSVGAQCWCCGKVNGWPKQT